MIFLTVGTQLPFERLVRAVDDWAAQHPETSVIGQVGRTVFQPSAFSIVSSLGPEQYYDMFEEADVVVAHAGMGTIISALERAKPLLLMPRLASLNEHRNDHQLGTAAHFKKYETIRVVEDASRFDEALDRLLDDLPTMSATPPEIMPSPALLERLRGFALKK